MINQDLKTTDKAQTHSASQGRLLVTAIAWLAGLSVICSIVGCQQALKAIATDPLNGYDKDLSKISSGQASRYQLAFFVSNICRASQAKYDKSTAPICLSQGRTVYDGVTSQNKIANRRICGAVSTDTESEPRHPILLPYSVTLTHKSVGGHNHA